MKQRLWQNSSVRTLTRLYPFVISEKPRLWLAAGLTAILTIVEIAAPILVGMAVDLVLNGAQSVGFYSLNLIVALLVMGAFARLFLLARQQGLTGEIGERVAANIRRSLWKHLLRLPVEYTRRRGSGKLLLRFTGDSRSVQRLVAQGIVRFLQDILLAIGAAAALVWINWRMALAVMIILPLFGIIFVLLNPRLREASRRVRGRRSRISGYLHEHIAGMPAVKACVRQTTEAEKFDSLLRGLVNRGKHFAAIGGWLQGTSAGAIAGAGALILLIAGGEIGANRLTGGALVAFYTLLGLLLPVFQRVVTANRYLQEASISLQRVSELLATVPEENLANPRPVLQITAGEIKAENLSFEYENGKPALHQVSFVARHGELVALVGANGAGKSTLLDLLLGFRQPTAGKILIDGQNIARVALDSLRAEIGLVTQTTALFSGTILENVIYGAAGDERDVNVEKALRLTGVNDFANDFPEKLETVIGSEGGTLSGGQRQRIALARALAANPPILILDEATSALDAENETALAETLRELAQEKTVIIAAHRLPTLRLADRIYVLQKGRILEQGTHKTLLRCGGEYARLFADEEKMRRRLEIAA
jgi:subfamily B ATP-binding cassette protein MsbA